MPTRILREGIISSEPINRLPMLSELFYRRLMSVVDDYGRYYSHPSILRANCYPMRLGDVSEADVKQMLSDCIAVGLLVIYGDGKYLCLLNFKQQTRSKSKFPQPPDNALLTKCESHANQMLSLVGVGDVVEDEGEGGDGARAQGGQAVELPHGFPSDEQAARQVGEMVGIPPDFAESVWVKAAGRGGRDAKDVAIRSFVHHLRTEWKYQQERVAKEKHHANNQPNGKPRVDRNEGTLNAGTSAQYGKLAAMGKLPVPRGPTT